MNIIPKPHKIKTLSPARFAYSPEDAEKIYDPTVPAEGYKLVSSGEGLKIFASDDAGFFYGKISAEWLGADGDMPDVIVSDAPRFAYRGFMIDCARHFFSVEELLKRIDTASKFKLNVFHWHLTDDQGWRAEIERYPRLTEIGSYRTSTRGDGKPVKGFYTKADMRRVVEYAAERFINVLPEVDLPGHMSAAVASYPQLGCTGAEIAVKDSFGIHEDVLCAGNDFVYEFICNVIDELAEIFPFGYFHIGGDEALRLKWLDCEKCREKMRLNALADEDELQGYMMNHALAHLKKLGKRGIVWNDGMASNVDPEAVMQYWKDDGASLKKAVARMRGGTDTVMSPFFAYYLDYPYGMTPLKKCFMRNPVPKGADEKKVLGVECALWTEYVDNADKLDYQLFPRLAAVAERAWSAWHTDYRAFKRRLRAAYNIFDKCGVKYATMNKADPNPIAALVSLIRFALNVMDPSMKESLLRQKLNAKRLKEKYSPVNERDRI